MADPVSNQNPVAVNNGKRAAGGQPSETRAPREPEGNENRPATATGDTVKISEAGASMSASGAGGATTRIESREEALSLAQQLREQLSGNNAMALAAQGSNTKAAAAALEKSA